MKQFALLTGLLLIIISYSVQAQSSVNPQVQSLYVTMSDDARIAIDLWLPADTTQPVPTLLTATRYWRGIQNAPDPNPDVAYFLASGYAVVVMDVRGSGASEGVQSMLWSDREVADMDEVMDWIVEQAWSNGRIGTYGGSYSGNAAEVVAMLQHPALKAVALQFSFFDFLANLALPGGAYNLLTETWQEFTRQLDAGDVCALEPFIGVPCADIQTFTPGIRNVDEDADRAILDTIIAARTQNVSVVELMTRDFREDMTAEGESFDSVSPYGRAEAIENSGVPMFIQIGWLDGATVDGALSRYLTLDNPQQLMIGPWSHGGQFESDPFSPPDTAMNVEEQYAMLVDFFDPYLKDDQTPPQSSITYYTMNGGTWSTTSTWPPDGVEMQRWFFAPEAGLSPDAPVEDEAEDIYTVDFTATTGTSSRWYTPVTIGDVIYTERAAEDAKLLTYTSPTLEQDIEITGNPVVTLYITSTEADGTFHVYLEDVAPDGTVTYITEGILRAIHRNVTDDAPYTPVGPYHSLREADALPLVPGEVAELQFNLYATSVLIEQGHQIRIAIAGADADNFRRYPVEGSPTITVFRNAVSASFIDLPIRTP
jgi:uncharacterized protein